MGKASRRKHEKRHEFVTLDGRTSGRRDPADDAAQFPDAADTIPLDPQLFTELGRMAAETHESFLAEAVQLITDTPARAAEVRRLRVDDGCSWRAVAHECFDSWQGTWSPPSNQLMGMALCEVAARVHDEEYMREPWN
jgi:hypothetical protein